jgi:hypothetical protein
MSAPLSQPDRYRAAFAAGLARMLDTHDGLGVTILVLANAAYDPALWAVLSEPLRARHAWHATRLHAGAALPDAPDDVDVFRKLDALGFDAVRLAETRAAGDFEIQFNMLRALRPPRASHARLPDIAMPFDDAGFHFDKPFLAKEILWSGELAGRGVDVLYNKFPFAPLHALLAPERDAHRPQWLTRADHDWAWSLANTLPLPGLGVAYNSLGALASVNHLHFQLFVRETPLPVERLIDAGRSYPANVRGPRDADAAWAAIEALHETRTPYNLIYRAGRMWLFPRRPQGELACAPWHAGCAWLEMAGVVSVVREEDYARLDAEAITAELERATR